MIKQKLPFTFLLFFFLICFCHSQNPTERWQKYASPELAGWSSEKLKKAEAFADSIGSSAFMLIQDGKVVVAWGDISRRFMCHSVRKSLLSALYGFYADAGELDLNNTLKDLEIDDVHQLTELEKTAKISDLLKTISPQ